MARIAIASQPYAGRSVIASGQECVNLYGEINQKDDPQAPSPVTWYPTPGTRLYADPAFAHKARGAYRTSKGTAYYVVGSQIYFLTATGALVQIGFVADLPSQCYFSDNGQVVVMVDGQNGYVIDMDTNDFGLVVDGSFYGADFVVFLDTFFVFNRPGTNQFYTSLSNVDFAMLTGGTAFDPLDIAAKSGFSDPIISIAAVHRELKLIGNQTTEVWIGTGAADFYFQQVQGAFIMHGSSAQYSQASTDDATFFMMQDPQGSGMVVSLAGYQVAEISTPRIVEEFKSYERMDDAIGFTFQIGDHGFYALVFPTANKAWMFDIGNGWWNEWNWCDMNGNFNRCRANCAMFVNGKNLVGDWENGRLLELSLDVYTDDNLIIDAEEGPIGKQPIIHVRTFPHMNTTNHLFRYDSFSADMEVGTIEDLDADPQVSLSWSDDKGKTYGMPIEQPLGKTGDYLASPKWPKLGRARDRVFKLSWAADCKTALNGGFYEGQDALR